MEAKIPKKNLETWLVNLKKLVGKDVVISLLVTDKGVSFIKCSSRHIELDEYSEEESEFPDIKLDELGVPSSALHDSRKQFYLG